MFSISGEVVCHFLQGLHEHSVCVDGECTKSADEMKTLAMADEYLKNIALSLPSNPRRHRRKLNAYRGRMSRRNRHFASYLFNSQFFNAEFFDNFFIFYTQ